MSSAPRIAIIGAGPAGLCLAAILQRHNQPFTIFEADATPSSRNQGGSLDLHPALGQAALAAAGLLAQFHAHARPEGEATRLLTMDGRVLWDDNTRSAAAPALDRGRPEIDRTVLRALLLAAVDPAAVQWGTKLVRALPDTPVPGQTTLELATASGTHTAGPFDLLIGADGAWSHVRPLLTEVRPAYSGITGVELWAHNTAVAHPWLDRFVGAGSVFVFDEGRAIMAQRQGAGDARFYAAVRVPEDWKDSCGIEWSAPDARAQLIATQYADAAPELQRALREADDKLVVRPLYQLPVGHTWSHRAGVTLLGDAAHLMTPFAGVGVNVALADAKDLADAILEATKDARPAETTNDAIHPDVSVAAPEATTLAAALAAYETKMWARGTQAATKTAHGLKMHFSARGGPERAGRLEKQAEMLRAMAEEKAAAEKVAEEKVAEEKVAEEKVAEEKAAEKVAEEKVAEEKVAEEKVAEEKVAEKVVEEKVAQEKVSEEKVAEEKAAEKAAEKVAEEKVAEEKVADDKAAEKVAEVTVEEVKGEEVN